MGLIAVLAAAVAALCGAAITVGGVTGAPVLLIFAATLALGAVGAIRRPVRKPLTLPPWAVRGLIGVGVVAAIGLAQMGASALSLVVLLPFAVPAVSLLWPRPVALRASVVLSGTSLVGPAASASDDALLIFGLLAGSAVALTASARLSHDLLRRMAKPVPGRERRTLAAAGAVLAVALVVGILASLLIRPPSSGPGDDRGRGDDIAAGRPPVAPAEGTTGPGDLAFDDRYDTAGPGPSGNATLLRVRADRPEVWRTQTFDEWDGRGWRQSPERGEPEPAEALDARRWLLRPSLTDDQGGERSVAPVALSDILFQRFTVEAPYLDVLAAAARPVQVRAISQQVHRNELEAVRTAPPLGRGARYTVVSLRSQPSPDDLRASDGPTPSRFRQAGSYLRLPAVPDRVGRLAAEVTAGAPTTYDKVKAIERWLAANVRTEPSGAAAVPDGADVVDTALFGTRSASAAQLATAMVVLLRAVGVPSRLGVGFLPGRRGAFGGDFVVRAGDAHAWVEVGFGIAGWQRFDPSGRIAASIRADSALTRLLRFLRPLAPLLALALAVAAGWALWRLIRRRRRERSLPWVTRYWARVVKAGAGGGLPRDPSDTPVEYAAALADSVLPDERLRDVGAIVTDAAFSGREPPPETRSWAEQVLDDAVSAARRERRRARFRRETEEDRPREEAGV